MITKKNLRRLVSKIYETKFECWNEPKFTSTPWMPESRIASLHTLVPTWILLLYSFFGDERSSLKGSSDHRYRWYDGWRSGPKIGWERSEFGSEVRSREQSLSILLASDSWLARVTDAYAPRSDEFECARPRYMSHASLAACASPRLRLLRIFEKICLAHREFLSTL